MAANQHVRFWLACAAVALAGVAPLAQQDPKIGPRDQLTITVMIAGEATPAAKHIVDADGTIKDPQVGQLKVAGKTPSQVGAEIGQKLKDLKIYSIVPQVRVELQQTPNKKVTVTGAVGQPGLVTYAGEITVLDALVRAGSATADAADQVLIVRAPAAPTPPNANAGQADENIIEVSLRELQGQNVAAHNITLQDGDYVIVQRAQMVTISGHVRSQGAYRVESGATVLQAVALAGGLSERGTWRGLEIIRDKKKLKSVTKDTVVKPGDTIIVKASPW